MRDQASTRRRLLRTGALLGTLAVTGCEQFTDSGDDIEDTDGDGVIDSEDYAPRDPDVQREAQTGGTATEGGTETDRPTDTEAVTDTEAETAAATDSEWWDTNWNERYTLAITERSGADLSAYPVVTPTLDIPSAARDSIRVVDHTASEPLDFGVRESDGGYELTFKLSLSSNATREDVVVYYDNPDAASAAVPWETARNNVYDDFADGRRGDRWRVENGGWDERGSSMYSNGERADCRYELETPLRVSEVPVYWETRVAARSTGTGTDIRQARVGDGRETFLRVLFVRTYQNDDDGVGANIGWDSLDHRKLLRAGQFSVNDWIRMEATLQPDGDTTARAENETNGATGDRVYRDARPNGLDAIRTLRLFSNGGTPGGEWDYVKLRYSADPEPRVETV